MELEKCQSCFQGKVIRKTCVVLVLHLSFLKIQGLSYKATIRKHKTSIKLPTRLQKGRSTKASLNEVVGVIERAVEFKPFTLADF